MKISHILRRLICLAFAAGSGWFAVWSYTKIMAVGDECNFRLKIYPKLHLAYQPRPNITNDSPKKLEDFI